MSTVRNDDLSSAVESVPDSRFNLGLVYDVHKVLVDHGYRLPEPGPDGDKSAQNRAYGLALMRLSQLVRAFEGESES